MTWFRPLLLGFLLGVLSPAFAAPGAEPETVDEIVAGVEQTYKGVTSLRADFQQVTRSSALGTEDRQRGSIHLKRPRKMRMEFQGPTPRLMVTDGKSIWLYSPADKQAFVYRDLGTGGGGDMGVLLDDLDKIGDLFEVSILDRKDAKEGKSYTLELRPRKEAAFKKLRVVVSRRKFLLEKIVIVDQLDNETELSFQQIKLNVDLPDTDFVFVAPAGTQVVEGK